MLKAKFVALSAVLAAVSLSAIAAGSATASAVLECGTGDVEITRLGMNAVGTDTTANRNAEFVRLSNKGATCSVGGWKIHDSYKNNDDQWGNSFTIPTGTEIASGNVLYVYNGSGTNDSDSIYRNFKHHFNNAGDKVYVTKNNGDLVDSQQFSPYQVWSPLP